MTQQASNTLARLCAGALAREPSLAALEFDERWVGWGEMRHVAERIHLLIEQSGADANTPVVFVPRNRPAAVAAFLALLAAGRTVRMVYAFQSVAGIARDIERLEPSIVVAAEGDFSPEVRGVLQKHRAAGIALREMDAVAIEGLERAAEGARDSSAPPEVQILTSGTTGAPKRFSLTHDMIAKHIVGANKNYAAMDHDLSRQPPLFQYFPLGNISGIYGTLPAMLRGHRTVLVDRFDLDAWRSYIRRHKPDRASLPPAAVRMVLDAEIPVAELAALRCIATGAAPLDLDVQSAFEARYKLPILVSYGATEFGGPVTSMTLEQRETWGDRKLGSVGLPIAGAQLRVIDPESGAVLGPDQEGILEVIAPRIGPDWIRTSDLALIDQDGFLFHRGRADGAIMRGGFKLLPETIERALGLHRLVAASAVVGIPDARLGEVPVAVVQLKTGAPQPTTAELEQHLREHVYATHIPVAWRFVAELPRTASFKLDGSAVRALFDAARTGH